MVTSKKYKYAKKTKRSRTRRQRHRRRQMRGGELGDILSFLKPTVETNDTCKEKYDKCLDKVSGKEDDSFFKLPTFDLFGKDDGNNAAATAQPPEQQQSVSDDNLDLDETKNKVLDDSANDVAAE